MVKIQYARIIDGSVHDAWELVSDVPAWPLWNPLCKSAEQVSQDPPTYHLHLLRGYVTNTQATVVRFHAPTTLVLEGRGHGLQCRLSFFLEAMAGQTKATILTEYYGTLVRFIGAFLDTQSVGRMLSDWIDALQRALTHHNAR